jgi:hypothetical protein
MLGGDWSAVNSFLLNLINTCLEFVKKTQKNNYVPEHILESKYLKYFVNEFIYVFGT